MSQDFEKIAPHILSRVLEGGAMPVEFGQKLADAGIYLVNLIGASEGGAYAISGSERTPRFSRETVLDFARKRESDWFRTNVIRYIHGWRSQVVLE